MNEPGSAAFGGSGYDETKNKVQDLIDTLADLKKQQDERNRLIIARLEVAPLGRDNVVAYKN